VNTLDNQFAFWEMQIRGVDTGIAAAAFLSHLWPQLTGCLNTEDDEGGPVRVHVIGHSFGGLVVANMARHLCLDTNNRDRAADLPVVPRLASLTLLEGAIASAWFEGERRLKRYVRDCIAAIYSAYDSANGFYYPLANGGRCAAGYVGLFRVGDKRPVLHCPVAGSPGHRGLFASLVSSPGLRRLLDEHLGKIPHDTNADGLPYVVNLDASRMIFDGPVSAGGGHADIFKDDVVHLLWEVTRLRPQAAIVPAPPVLTVPRKVAARLREVLVGRPLP
jgi:pimeloyl-ACP methyl ester carboxylesterase